MSKEIKACRAPDPNPVKPSFRMPANACDAHCHVFGPAAKFPFAADRTYTDNDLADLKKGGMCGIRFNFVKHLGGMQDIDLFDQMIERIEPLGWHVVLHLDAEDIEEHASRIKRMKVPFVIDHMGRVKAAEGLEQKAFRILLDLMKYNPLAWVKICGSERVSVGKRPFKDAVPFARALIEAAPGRILWGTDWPHPNISKDMPNDGELVDLIPEFTSDPGLQQKILVDNPALLYGF